MKTNEKQAEQNYARQQVPAHARTKLGWVGRWGRVGSWVNACISDTPRCIVVLALSVGILTCSIVRDQSYSKTIFPVSKYLKPCFNASVQLVPEGLFSAIVLMSRAAAQSVTLNQL